MSYFRKPNPKSNWKRPKPKIYDCNARDLEKFYQSSYSEYVNNKEDIKSRQQERENRDAEALARRFEQRRAASLSFGDDDSSRPSRFIPARNDSSSNHESTTRQMRNGHSSNYDSTMRQTNSSVGDDSFTRSTASSSRQVSFNSTLNDPDSNSEMSSIESRLGRLRKLREDLGLPSEIGGTNSSSSTLNSSHETHTSTRRGHSPREPREQETSSRFLKNGTSLTSESYSRKSPNTTGLNTSSSSSSRIERHSDQNGLDDSTKSYSFKSKASSGNGLDDSYSYKSKSNAGNGLDDYESTVTSRIKSRTKVEKPSLDGIDLDFDDDALLSDMRKKIPSSKDILDRIKNMDMD